MVLGVSVAGTYRIWGGWGGLRRVHVTLLEHQLSKLAGDTSVVDSRRNHA